LFSVESGGIVRREVRSQNIEPETAALMPMRVEISSNAEPAAYPDLKYTVYKDDAIKKMRIRTFESDNGADNSAALQMWFEKHGLSKHVQKLRQPNDIDGDGAAGNVQWPYFGNKCMQQRQAAVAHEMLNRGCEHVLEVGGYLTPLDNVLRDLVKQNRSLKLPKSYTNIDPSVDKPKDVTTDGMRAVHIPMTISDFVANSAASFRKDFGLTELSESSEGSICMCMLSVWDPHVDTGSDRSAMQSLISHAGFLAASSAFDELEHLSVVETIADHAHRLKPHHKSSIDCTTELMEEESHFKGDEVERLEFMSLLQSGKIPPLLMMSWA
jgi:hypothetical protein